MVEEIIAGAAESAAAPAAVKHGRKELQAM
jgi:hypothetical protein